MVEEDVVLVVGVVEICPNLTTYIFFLATKFNGVVEDSSRESMQRSDDVVVIMNEMT